MFDVVIEQEISAAHQLRGYQGKCENLHGHNWKVRLEVTAEKQDECGLAIDFCVLKEKLKKILEKYDHAMLNEIDCFKNENPTSENIAKRIYLECQNALLDYPTISVRNVSVWESPRSFVRYYEN